MSVFFNLGSLMLGLAAWGLPFLAIGKKDRFSICCLGSFGCCILSLLLQLFEVKNRVNLEDWSALMDTMHAVVLAAVVMIMVMVVCNLIALLRTARR